MSFIVGVTSSRSSPGATSLSVGISWAFARRSLGPLLVEADPFGGVLSQRFKLPPQPSLTSLVREARTGLSAENILANCQNLAGVSCLVGSVDPVTANPVSNQLAQILSSGGYRPTQPVVVDMGRWSDGRSWLSLSKAVDHVLLVTTSKVEDVQSARYALRSLQDAGCSVGLVVIGNSPNPPEKVAEALEVWLAGGVAYNLDAANALTGGSFSESDYQRSLLGRSIDGLAASILGQSS